MGVLFFVEILLMERTVFLSYYYDWWSLLPTLAELAVVVVVVIIIVSLMVRYEIKEKKDANKNIVACSDQEMAPSLDWKTSRQN
jgi:uncharacterized membrane protein